MSAAQAYNRTKNFAENNPDRTDHTALNAELDKVATSINELRTNLAILQKDDGSLQNAVVALLCLTSEALTALSVPGPVGPQGPQGPAGPVGQQGPKGDVGSSFNADVRDLFANRGLYGLQPKGFSFLAIDTGMLYFKQSATSNDWSTGYAYGKGDAGDTGPQGQQGLQGIQGLQGLKGDTGDTGPAGSNGLDGVVTSIDTATKTASLVGRTNITAKLVLTGGQLAVQISTT